MRPRRNIDSLRIIPIAAAILLTCNPAPAEVIPNTQILFSHGTDTEYGASVLQTTSGDYTEIAFSYTGTTLGFLYSDLDEESDWYLVNAGDVFAPSTIAANQFPIIF